jgi:hypothetical protein
MSNPDLTSEMACWLQDNTVEFLKGATEEELTEFVNTLLPHISPVGVNRIYPLVAESFPSRLTPTHGMIVIEPDDDLPINYGGTD